MNNLRNYKRQIIDCSSCQNCDNESRRNQSSQDLYEIKKNNEKQKLQYILNKDSMNNRAALTEKTPECTDYNLNQDPFGEDIFTNQKMKTINKQLQGFIENTQQKIQKPISSKSSIFDSKHNSNKNLVNNQQNYALYDYKPFQKQNSKERLTDRQSTSQQMRSQKIKSLSNIELDESKQNTQTESLNIVINQGRQIVHQKEKKSIEQNQNPPVYFTTPQYKTTKKALQQIEQEVSFGKKIDQEQKSGILNSQNSKQSKDQYLQNTQNNQTPTSNIPCFSISQQTKHQLAQIIKQTNNTSNIFPQSKCSSSQSQTRSSQNLDYGKEFLNQKKNHLQKNNALDEEQKKQMSQSQNEPQAKFDLLHNLFTSNKQVKGNKIKNGSKNINQAKGFQKQMSSSQNKIQSGKYENYYPNGHQDQINYEQNDPFYNFNISKNTSRIGRGSLKGEQIDKIVQFMTTSTTNATDQLDTCSSQADSSIKNCNADNVFGDNKVCENRYNQNFNNKYDDFLSNKNNWIFQKNNLMAASAQTEKINSKIQEINQLNIEKPQNKNLQRLNSLHHIEELDNENQNKQIVSRKYQAASFTKLPSTCQLNKLTRNGLNTVNYIKSTSEISSQSELQAVDEKKMLEDYRQYQLRNKLDIQSKSAAAYDVENQQFILNVQGGKLTQIASLTKIMTCYIVCDLINKTTFQKSDIVKISLKQNQTVKISKIASKMKGTTAFLCNGDELSLWSLLHALMLPSGNDAAFTLSEHVGSIIYENSPIFQQKKYENPNIQSCNPKTGQREFIRIMNLYSEKMKLKNTYFQNPHGLCNSKNKSTAIDLCLLVNHAMKNSYFREIVKTAEYTAQIVNASKGNREITWENTQKLLKRNKFCNGVKTGITPDAGPCLASSFTISNRNFIIVILNTTSLEMRFTETMSIFKFIVEIYELHKDKKEDITKELNYQPDQENIIEQKYLKKGWEITSANIIISTHELDDDDDSSDEGENDYNEDEDIDNYNNIENTTQSEKNKKLQFNDDVDIRNNNKVKNNLLKNDKKDQNKYDVNNKQASNQGTYNNQKVSRQSQNDIQNNNTKMNQNIQNKKQIKGSFKQSTVKVEDITHNSKKINEQHNQIKKIFQEGTKKEYHNIEDKQLHQQYNHQLNSSRDKQLTKINEEDV